MGRISSAGGDISTHYGDMDVWLCRIDSVGNILWEKTLGNAWKDNGLKIKLTSSNTILFIGGHEMVGDMIDCPDYGYIFTDVWVVELDLHGNILDQWCYGGKYYDLGWDVIETEDGFIIAASTRSNDRDVSGFHGTPGGDFDDIWIFKIDLYGNIIWQKCLGGNSWEYPVYITKTEDNGCVIIGNTCSLDGDVSGNHSMYDYYADIWVVKLNGNGELEWEHCFGGLGTERFWGTNSVLKIDDYNYVIGANTNYLDQDVGCDLFPNNIIDYNAWLLEIKDCNYYMPAAPVIASGPDTLCSTTNATSIYSINPVTWSWGYEWSMEPENAGIMLQDSLNAEITWNPQYEGPVAISARSYNDCGYSAWSEPHITQVYTCLGTGEYFLNEFSLIIIPNPVNDKVTISVKGRIQKKQIEISFMNLLGSEVKKGMFSESEESTEIDVSELPAGIYFISILKEGKRIASGKMIVSR